MPIARTPPPETKRKRAPRKTTVSTKPAKKKPDMRWKDDERETSRSYQAIDGPPENATLRALQSSTGRLGHLTDLRVDSASKHYMIEVKRRKLTGWLFQAWVLIQQKAKDFNVDAVLVLNMVDLQNSFMYLDKKYPCEDLHCVTASRHAHLLQCERELAALREEA